MSTFRSILVSGILVVLLTAHGSSAEPAPQADESNRPATSSSASSTGSDEVADSSAREEVLTWLDQYLTKEVLFRPEDIQAVRNKVAQMSPPQLQSWLDETKEIRDTLNSDQWKSTQAWLEEYLPTKLYSDDEVKEFQAAVGRMSPGELTELLKRIQQKHDTLQSVYDAQAASSLRQRQAADTARIQAQSRMGWRNSYDANQKAARQVAQRQSATRSSRPLYGNTQVHAARRHTEASRRYNQPIITSRQAGQIAVTRAIAGPYGRW